jgi:hypothetical protein
MKDEMVTCDCCGKQLYPTDYVTRYRVVMQVNNGRRESAGRWFWERPMIKHDDPVGARNEWSDTAHYCEECRSRGLDEVPKPTGVEGEGA